MRPGAASQIPEMMHRVAVLEQTLAVMALAGLAAAGAGCAGAWSDPRPAPGVPNPAQPTGTAARPAGQDPPRPETRTDLTPDKADSLRAAFLLDSLARADSARADSLRRAGQGDPGRR
jgi:hypothetical protein